jgi:hypothetical protein
MNIISLLMFAIEIFKFRISLEMVIYDILILKNKFVIFFFEN